MPGTLNVQIGSIKRTLPGGWEQLTARQLRQVARILITAPQPMAIEQLAVGWLKIQYSVVRQLTWQQLFGISHHLQYLTTAPGGLKVPAPWLSWPWYRRPALSYNGYSWYEFTLADTFFMRYSRYKDPRHLNTMLAVLYRPPVLPVTGSRIDRRAQYIRRTTTMAQRHTALLYYRAMRRGLEQRYRNVFAQGTGKPASWGEVTLSVSGGPLGTLAEVKMASLHEVLGYLNTQLKK